MNADFSFRFDEPIVCTAIHNGHDICPKTKANLGITEEVRLMEEDPKTELFAQICNNLIIGRQSRFEFDLNRTREKAVYLKPEDAWGLPVRKEPPKKEQIEQALQRYDNFYRRVTMIYEEMITTFGRFFVYDIHSYNHHRKGKDAPFDEPEKNPEIVLGTSNMDEKWFPLIDKIEERMKSFDFFGRSIDVRQNVRFPGGNFSRWTHKSFPGRICSVAIEFKKIFMDEWSGEFYPDVMNKLKELLASTKPVILSFLQEM